MGSWKIACFSSNPYRYRVFLDGNLSNPAAKKPTLQAIFTSLGNKEMWGYEIPLVAFLEKCLWLFQFGIALKELQVYSDF